MVAIGDTPRNLEAGDVLVKLGGGLKKCGDTFRING